MQGTLLKNGAFGRRVAPNSEESRLARDNPRLKQATTQPD